jgi:N-acetylmuramate 1-kinase
VIDLHPLEALASRSRLRIEATEPMPGGASTRSYYRLHLAGGGTAVAMFVPGGDRPDEIEKRGEFARGRRSWPFLEVRDLLERRGVRVPRLYGESTRDGWLLLEDLGDETLDAGLRARPAEQAPLYKQAVGDLRRAQVALAELPDGSVVASRAFDFDLLRAELDHFREWGLEARGRAVAGEPGWRASSTVSRAKSHPGRVPSCIATISRET